MVITMAKLRMAHASTHGARKPPGPIRMVHASTHGARKPPGPKSFRCFSFCFCSHVSLCLFLFSCFSCLCYITITDRELTLFTVQNIVLVFWKVRLDFLLYLSDVKLKVNFRSNKKWAMRITWVKNILMMLKFI